VSVRDLRRPDPGRPDPRGAAARRALPVLAALLAACAVTVWAAWTLTGRGTAAQRAPQGEPLTGSALIEAGRLAPGRGVTLAVELYNPTYQGLRLAPPTATVAVLAPVAGVACPAGELAFGRLPGFTAYLEAWSARRLLVGTVTMDRHADPRCAGAAFEVELRFPTRVPQS
jgi:hypothetical protein